jgi:hypothetical protein
MDSSASSFSFLEEVWSPEQNCQPIAENDIMSAFVENKEGKCFPPTAVSNAFKPQQEDMPVEGWSPNGGDYFAFDQFFQSDMISMKANMENDDVEQEEKIIIRNVEEPQTGNDVSDILEKYDNNSMQPPKPYQQLPSQHEKPFLTSELIIFILCGIILILLFDKFISMGKAMR